MPYHLYVEDNLTVKERILVLSVIVLLMFGAASAAEDHREKAKAEPEACVTVCEIVIYDSF